MGKNWRSAMRIESSVTSVSWIPSEAIEGVMKSPFEMGVAHYDSPPPAHIDDIEELHRAEGFRFANRLHAWVDVEDGRITGHGQDGRGYISVTRVKLGPATITFQPVAFGERRPEPEVGEGWVRFTQTTGGRTGVAMPRRVKTPPFVQLSAPSCWTTLSLTIHADGTSRHEVVGASQFPRHWIYDHHGDHVQKSGTTDFRTWSEESFGSHTPWGDEESPALVTEVESALERELSQHIMRGGQKPQVRRLERGTSLVEQGSPGDEIFLLLDGVLSVHVDGKALAQVGPGAVVGERALLESGTRTATLRAETPCKVAVVTGDQVASEHLEVLAAGHRREES
jgi:hypothetical protein